MEQQNVFIPKLGIIAISFGNGSIGVYAIPKPKKIRERFGLSSNETLFGNQLILFFFMFTFNEYSNNFLCLIK